MAVEISINNLNSWLSSQSNNTASTAYSVKIVDLTGSNLSDVRTALINNPTKYVDLRETLFPQCDLKELFQNCVTLVNSPNTEILRHERSYGSTEDVYIQFAFDGCSSLKSFSCRNAYQLVNTNNYINSSSVFNGCTNLTDFYSENPYYMKQWVTSIQSSSRFPNAVSDCNFYFIDTYDYIICQVNDLNNLLQMLPQNTISTAYKIKLGNVDNNNRANLTSALLSNLDKYVDLSETRINMGSGFLTEQFKDCTNLVYAPKIYSGVLTSTFKGCTNLKSADLGGYSSNLNSLENTFSGCSSLTEVTLPNTIKRFNNNVFEGCSALNTLKISTLNSSTSFAPTVYTDVFKDCSNLLNFYCDSPYQVKTWLTTIHNESTNNFPNAPDRCNYFFYSELSIHIIPFRQLNDTLAMLQANTADTAYNIKVTDLTANNLGNSSISGTLGYVLKANNTKYVDLSETVLPNDITDLSDCFNGCVSLVVSPILPNNTTLMARTYKGCTALISMPTIPSSVLTIDECFCNCSSLTQVTELPNLSYANSAFKNCTSLVTPPDFPTEASMAHTFEGCTSLTSIPNFPPKSSLFETFKGCTSLTTVPAIQLKDENYYCDITSIFEGCTSLTSVEIVIGDDISMLDMGSAFSGCTALQSFKVKEFNKRSISSDGSVFKNCTNLLNFYTDTPYELKTWLTELRNRSTNDFPNNINNCHFYLYSTDYVEFHISNLNNELSSLTANTVSTPFKIKITGITDGDSGTDITDLNAILLANLTKYVDLKETVIPNGIMIFGSIYKDCTNLIKAPNNIPNSVVSMSQAFSGCTNLVEVPPLPNNVTNLIDAFNGCSSLTSAPVIPASVGGMTNTFKNCTSLTEAPVIPDSVNIMLNTFEGCTSLETVPNVPASVVYFTECFKDCSSLEEIELFEVPTSVLESHAADCFSGCTSLTKVGIPAVENPEASDWHIALLEFGATTVKGKFYDRQGNSVTIPETTITKDKLKLSVLTDELMFNTQTSFADLETLVSDILQYNYGYFNKFVISPKNQQFVLYADDPVNGFTTNLPIGGGTQVFDLCYPVGCTYTQYPKQKSPMELWGSISVWEILDYGGAYFRSEGGEALSFDTNVMAIESMSGSNITITNHNAEVGTIIYDFTNNESRTVASISGNVITLDSPFTDASTLRDVLIGQPQSLPNIRASVSCDSEGLFNGRGSIRTSGAFSVSGGNKYAGGDNGDSGRPHTLGFNAQAAEPTYGRRDEVSPNAFTKVVWVRTA